MKKIKNYRDIFNITSLVIFGLFLVFLHINKGIPDVDSATFLYIGRGILDGLIPYKDIFDHKPPLIFFINSIGLVLSNNSIVGIWIIELFCLIIAIFYGYKVMNLFFGRLPAYFASVSWISSFSLLLDGGNLTEEYAIPLIFASIYIFAISELKKESLLKTFLLGIFFALVFLLKQTLIGIFVSIYIYKIIKYFKIKEYKQIINYIYITSLSILLVFGVVISYFTFNNALWDFWNFAYRFNMYYSGRMFSNFFNVLYHGFYINIYNPLLWLGVLAWFDLLVVFIYQIKRPILKMKLSLLGLLAIALPIEFILVSTSGKIYTHYYQPWIPVLSILVCYLIYGLLNIYSFKEFNLIRKRILKSFFYLSIVWIILFASYQVNIGITKSLSIKYSKPQIYKYISENTNKGEYILVWGVGSTINFVSERNSPTRYVYQSPLYTQGFQEPYMYYELLDDIKLKKPVLIFDPHKVGGRFPPIDCSINPTFLTKESKFKPIDEIKMVVDYICENYRLDKNLEGYKIYKLK